VTYPWTPEGRFEWQVEGAKRVRGQGPQAKVNVPCAPLGVITRGKTAFVRGDSLAVRL